MAHFRGTVQGNRGLASRLGSKGTGLTTSCNGWTSGVTVKARYDDQADYDVFNIYATTGSSCRRESKRIGVVIEGKFYTEKQYMSSFTKIKIGD